ncbi:FtsX-like permease family protein [Gammaproteobacteria bacterium AB-CW1]|uniref:FtsX-like permease family protein n=1 Tax=Natronospira elongata TaxID=3110268 RepID=A0AAP6JEY2_9GAMM|nr:FtsX-like permease family protein [Gammaproteobacteria bacterium AB-CW1]
MSRSLLASGSLGLRLLRREWHGGELAVLLLALTLAVTAISAVGFFTDRVGAAMERRAAEVLAADVVLRSRAPLPDRFEARAKETGLKTAATVTLPTVVAGEERTQLIDLRAVDPAYPLRGEIQVADAPFRPGRPVESLIELGEAWVDARVLARLDLAVGDALTLGDHELRISQVLAGLPDEGIGFADVAPAVLVHSDELSATGLAREGSRVTHRLLVAGDRAAIRNWRQWAESELEEGQSLQDVSESRQEIGAAITRAESFLGLAALVSVLVAAVAVALSAREWARRRLDAVAVMKTLGAGQGKVLGLYLSQLLSIGLVGGGLGLAGGWLAQWGLVAILGGLLGETLPAAEPMGPVMTGLGTSLVLLLGFALPPLLKLRRTPPARVLRRESGPPEVGAWLVYGLALAAISILILSQARDLGLALQLLLVGGATLALLLAGGLLVITLVRRLGGRFGSAWRQGLGNLARYPGRSLALITAVGLGLMVLTLLSTVRGDLLDGWRATLPEDAANHFLINIQPDERKGVMEALDELGARNQTFSPLIRGRLVAINGEDVDDLTLPTERGRRFVQRDANLSWMDTLQADNRVVAGDWWDGSEHGEALVSLEEDIAEALGVGLGDRLSYRIGGREVELEISNLRSVRWDSFNTNFFVVTPPGTLEDAPLTWIASVYLPEEARGRLTALVRDYPSVTIIDVESILAQVRQIMDRASLAVEYVFAFTLLAGLIVLFAAVQASRDQRRFESALVRALGGRRRHVYATVVTEFGSAGALAGLLAGLGAALGGWLMAERVFELSYQPPLWLLPAVMGAGALLLAVAGWVASRRVVTRSALLVLREE